MSEAKKYTKALCKPDSLDTLYEIERRNNLLGYPPEIVHVGLIAINENRCPHQAIDDYIFGEALN